MLSEKQQKMIVTFYYTGNGSFGSGWEDSKATIWIWWWTRPLWAPLRSSRPGVDTSARPICQIQGNDKSKLAKITKENISSSLLNGVFLYFTARFWHIWRCKNNAIIHAVRDGLPTLPSGSYDFDSTQHAVQWWQCNNFSLSSSA